MLENKTIDEIYNIIKNQIETQLSQTIPILPVNFIYLLSKILAGVYIILYKVAGWIFLQMFINTASFKDVNILGKKINPLKEWNRLIGEGDPRSAKQAILDIDLTVLQIGQTLNSGTQFISNINGLIYITQNSYILSTNPFTIEVICVTPGILGNLSPGDIISIVNSNLIIEDDAEVNALTTAGIDEESETSYRNRGIERFQLQPQGGALADYRIWANEVNGVLQTFIYSGDIPSHVIVYVAGDPDIYTDRIPDSALLISVGENIDKNTLTGIANRRPITAVIDPLANGSYTNIKPINLILFDIEITDLVVDPENENSVKTDIYNAIENYFFTRGPFIDGLSSSPRKDNLSSSNLINIVDDIVTANNGTFTTVIIFYLTIITPLYILGEGELSKMDSLTINGSPFVPS